MSVTKFAVLGAGVMGSGIAAQAALAGIPTQLTDLSDTALARASANIDAQLKRQLERKKITPTQYETAQSALQVQTDQQGFETNDLVVEAVVESEPVKLSALQSVETDLPQHALLATNTSSISINRLAAGLKRPEQFCGLHFFNPVSQMRLVEVVKGTATNAATIDSCVEFAQRLEKQPIVVSDCPGFLVNRILFPYFHGFDQLLKEGVSFERIDSVMEDFGWPMGPAYLADVIGMDVMVGADRVLQQGYPERMTYESSSIFERLLDAGMLGQKSGQGFYQFEVDAAGNRQRLPNPAVPQLVSLSEECSSITDTDIQWRMMLPMLTEALRALDEGVVQSCEDLTLAARLGLGFPDTEGGIWGYIQSIGQEGLAQKMCDYAALGSLYTYHSAALEESKNARV